MLFFVSTVSVTAAKICLQFPVVDIGVSHLLGELQVTLCSVLLNFMLDQISFHVARRSHQCNSTFNGLYSET